MKIEQLTAIGRLALIIKWYDWFYANTETFEGELGMQLAYLWPCIAKGEQMAADEGSAIIRLLKYREVAEHETIWDYLLIEPEEEL